MRSFAIESKNVLLHLLVEIPAAAIRDHSLVVYPADFAVATRGLVSAEYTLEVADQVFRDTEAVIDKLVHLIFVEAADQQPGQIFPVLFDVLAPVRQVSSQAADIGRIGIARLKPGQQC